MISSEIPLLKKAILSTISYASIFNYPLKEDEIWEWLIFEGKQPLSTPQFKIALKELIKDKVCEGNKNYFFLLGRGELVKLREERQEFSKLKLKKGFAVIKTLKKIPWVKLIGITGSLARNNAEKKDDIDLFFITEARRLWLTRFLVVIVLLLKKVYRRGNKIQDRICPNMFISEDSLELETKDLFVAHEICLMKPIFDKGNVYQAFLHANLWVKDFLPNKNKRKFKKVLLKSGKQEFFPVLLFLNFAEAIMMRFQIWHMTKKMTNEVVNPKIIKFHPKDLRSTILTRHKSLLTKN